MNFVELCRKGAGWPSLHRDVPLKPEGQKVWSLSQDELAKFIGQVRTRSDDLLSKLSSKDELIAKLSDEKAAMAKELAEVKSKLWTYEASRQVKRRAESLGLEAQQVKALGDSVSA
jgi:peptidoglycan hydrolase CwlO-like protein